MMTGPPPSLSPKRKREPSESDYYSPSASPVSTVSFASLQEVRFREEEVGRHSPRAAVAGRFGELAIRGERRTSLGLPNEHVTTRGPTTPPPQVLSISEDFEAGPGIWLGDNNSRQQTLDQQSQSDVTSHYAMNDNPDTPVASPSNGESAIAWKQLHPVSPSKHRKQRLSPPLGESSKEDPFTWHDDEITGHDPSDPTDDGYGINGVGFKPTAAMAWARSQKRQKQVAEWKTREAREAREKRRERRNERDALNRLHAIQQGSIQKRVKFDV
ncbi:hypothetical protein N7478_009613 [Penicillium angulare]|uniref:uncharacterized protein n=1 Tax=Penicillium angulare TaxID=116970 RepID=UPI0025408A99|nr:uncharacterized protein N7478_009613 [Penicillium angulare]KAJ5266805.1 hypothetical protein N7478_009613 [Penicillium angulare]